MKTTNTIPLVAALLGLASANPGIFDDIKSDWDGAKSDIKAEASTLKSVRFPTPLPLPFRLPPD